MPKQPHQSSKSNSQKKPRPPKPQQSKDKKDALGLMWQAILDGRDQETIQKLRNAVMETVLELMRKAMIEGRMPIPGTDTWQEVIDGGLPKPSHELLREVGDLFRKLLEGNCLLWFSEELDQLFRLQDLLYRLIEKQEEVYLRLSKQLLARVDKATNRPDDTTVEIMQYVHAEYEKHGKNKEQWQHTTKKVNERWPDAARKGGIRFSNPPSLKRAYDHFMATTPELIGVGHIPEEFAHLGPEIKQALKEVKDLIREVNTFRFPRSPGDAVIDMFLIESLRPPGPHRPHRIGLIIPGMKLPPPKGNSHPR